MRIELLAQCLTPGNLSVNGDYMYTMSGIIIAKSKEK